MWLQLKWWKPQAWLQCNNFFMINYHNHPSNAHGINCSSNNVVFEDGGLYILILDVTSDWKIFANFHIMVCKKYPPPQQQKRGTTLYLLHHFLAYMPSKPNLSSLLLYVITISVMPKTPGDKSLTWIHGYCIYSPVSQPCIKDDPLNLI